MKYNRLLWIPYFIWLGAWLWVFTFGYSDSFFQYHRETRIPFALIAWGALGSFPLITYWSMAHVAAGKRSKKMAFALNLLLTALPVIAFWAVFNSVIIIARMHGKIAFEADEAMGIGIDLLLSMFAYVAINTLLGIGLLIMHLLGKDRKRKGVSFDEP